MTGTMFQFYDSPIKSAIGPKNISMRRLFQFYDSPIKRRRESLCCSSSRRSFNSMIVRLKVNENHKIYNEPLHSFNSMIVRLKGEMGDTLRGVL